MKKLYHRNVYWKPQFDAQSLTIIKSVERLSNHLWEHIDMHNKPRYNIDVAKLFLIINDDILPFRLVSKYKQRSITTSHLDTLTNQTSFQPDTHGLLLCENQFLAKIIVDLSRRDRVGKFLFRRDAPSALRL